ncbi:hypothetical protein BSKO_02958 [Bryopsis sp. KO-2023]|nr:hypothetical protein BSKO_02958 [Bryopsis sp. KO-2023]
MSLKVRLAGKLRECFTALGYRWDSAELSSMPDQETGCLRDNLAQESLRTRARSLPFEEARADELGLFGETPSRRFSLTTVEQLINTLKEGAEEEQAWAAEVLFDYTTDGPQSQEVVAGLGGVEPLVKMIQTGTTKGRLYAAYTLSALTSVADSRKEMERCGAVRALVEMLQASSTSVDGLRGALRAIGRLARSEASAAEVVASGGLSTLVTMLQSPDPGLLKRCLIALYFIGADKEDLQVEILKAGAIPYLLDLCMSPFQAVKEEAVDVCKVLSRCLPCSESIADQGGIEILAMVAAEAQSQRSRDTAAKALQRMSECTVLLKQKISKLGDITEGDDWGGDEITQLVEILNSSDTRLRERAARVVEQLSAGDPKAVRELSEPGIVSNLIDLLTTGSEEGRASAARALAELVEEVSVRTRVYLSGAVPPLIGVLKGGNARGQEGASHALQMLACHKEAARECAQGGNLDVFLNALDTGGETTQKHVIRTLFLLRGVDKGVEAQFVTQGAVSVFVRRCWRGTVEVQALVAAVIHDLCQSPANRSQLISNSIVPALLHVANSGIRDLVEMSCESLKQLGKGEFKPEVQTEIWLQDRITSMLTTTEARWNVRPELAAEEAIRMVPRGMFVGRNEVDRAYTGAPIVMSDLDLDVPSLHIHLQMLAALDLSPGHSFLEVGSSTGFLVCLATYLISPSGRAVGLEANMGGCAFAERQSEKLMAGRPIGELRPQFLTGDIVQIAKSSDKFDRLVVSASCNRGALNLLVGLLAPYGKMIVCCDGQLMLIHQELGLSRPELLCAYTPHESCHTVSDVSDRSVKSVLTLSESSIHSSNIALSSSGRRTPSLSKIPRMRSYPGRTFSRSMSAPPCHNDYSSISSQNDDPETSTGSNSAGLYTGSLEDEVQEIQRKSAPFPSSLEDVWRLFLPARDRHGCSQSTSTAEKYFTPRRSTS